MMNKKNVVVIDDSKEDLFFIKEAFKDNSLLHKLSLFNNSNDFMKFSESELSRPQKFPDLIILDLNMPGTNGLTLAHELRKSKNFETVPIVMLSGVASQADIYESYNNGINFFMKKPDTYDEWLEVVKTIDKVWLDV